MSKAPKLRFKEFSGDWESEKLGNLLEFKNGINASKEQYGHGKKFINVLDILNNNYITYENIIGKVDVDEDTFEKYSVGYGDIVFQRSSETREEVGTANVYLDKEQKATFGGFIIRGKKVGEYNPIFMNKLLKTSSARKEITTKAGGSTRYNVGQDTLSDVEVMLPKLEEQEKIASLFSLIDEKISLQSEKVEALKDYKKGMMQKIFRRELRFKDDEGKYYPEWKEKKLGDICELFAGGTPSTNVKEYWDGDINWITSGIVQNCTIYEKDVKTKITELGLAKSSARLINPDSVLIAMTGATCGKIGYLTFESTANQSVMAIEPYTDISKFVYYLLIHNNRYILKFQAGGAQAGINKSSCSNLTFKFPSIPEQEKIADFLSIIDSKIELEEQKLEQLKEMKKGLLQQMFV